MSVVDLVSCVLARHVRNDDVVGVGLGTPLALAACLLARRTHAPGATVLVGGAVSPEATLDDCLRGDVAGRTPGFVPHLETMEMAERQVMTLQFLRPAQVGPDGSANTSRIGALRLPGGLALADVVNLLPRVVLYHTAHEPRALPSSVAFLTALGRGIERAGYRARGVSKLVTDLCVIAFQNGSARLESIHTGVDVEQVVAATGFPLELGDPPTTDPPTDEELSALDAIDPLRLRELEFRALREAAMRRRTCA